MEIDKNKQQKELERVFLAPSVRPFLCLTVKENTDVEDEFEIIEGENKRKIQQTIHGNVFTTEIYHFQEIDDGTTMTEQSTIIYTLPYGTRLIWEEGQGYIPTKEKFQTLEEIEEVYSLLKE